jgi:AbrB family looped-hinge helix DNA binding protein
MKRKIIKQGHNTLTVTIPTKWADKMGLKPGDELDIEEKANTLVLKASVSSQKEKTTIDISDFDVALEKTIYSIYKKGYDEIELRSSDPALLGKVQKILLEIVVGFEIVSCTKNSCVIRSVVEIDDTEFSPIIRRTFLLLHSMGGGILSSIEAKDASSLASFRQMEAINNRYTGFCRRLLNKRGFGEPKNERLLYCLIEFLEKIPDEYKFLCDFLIDNPKEISKISKENIETFRQIEQLAREVEIIYYKFDMAGYLRLYRKRKELIRKINQRLPHQGGPNTMLLHYLLNVVQLCADLANLILTINL